MKKRPELLIPAGSPEVLRTAVRYGADAVYIGGGRFGLRAKAGNFTKEEMAEGIEFAHSCGVKVYVTVNIFAHNKDLEGLRVYLTELREVKPDGLIISDPGVYMLAKELLPEVERHISTQANNTNYETCRFWYELGAKRVVAARELSLEELSELRQRMPAGMKLEAFVHGAMCISYSGRCLLSSYFTGRDANQGACTHPCRWKYHVAEETRPGEYMPVEEDDRGTYIFNSRDLNMIEYVPELIGAEIDSFKIEGRMKNALYVATVARIYKQAILDYLQGDALYRKSLPFYREEIGKCTCRQFTTGFYFGKTDQRSQIYDTNTYINAYTYIGMVDTVRQHKGMELLGWRQKNKFSVGDELEAMLFHCENLKFTVLGIYDENLRPMESAPHAKQQLYVDLGCKLPEGVILRKKTPGAPDEQQPER